MTGPLWILISIPLTTLHLFMQCQTCLQSLVTLSGTTQACDMGVEVIKRAHLPRPSRCSREGWELRAEGRLGSGSQTHIHRHTGHRRSCTHTGWCDLMHKGRNIWLFLPNKILEINISALRVVKHPKGVSTFKSCTNVKNGEISGGTKLSHSQQIPSALWNKTLKNHLTRGL